MARHSGACFRSPRRDKIVRVLEVRPDKVLDELIGITFIVEVGSKKLEIHIAIDEFSEEEFKRKLAKRIMNEVKLQLAKKMRKKEYTLSEVLSTLRMNSNDQVNEEW